MAVKPTSELKNKFLAGSEPTSRDFEDLIDSFRHKSQRIPGADIEGWDSLSVGLGNATPDTDPAAFPKIKEWNALRAGTYGDFKDVANAGIVVTGDEEGIVRIYWNNETAAWEKKVISLGIGKASNFNPADNIMYQTGKTISDYLAPNYKDNIQLGFVNPYAIESSITDCNEILSTSSYAAYFDNTHTEFKQLYIKIYCVVAGKISLGEYSEADGIVSRIKFKEYILELGENIITDFAIAPGNKLGYFCNATTLSGRIGILNTPSSYTFHEGSVTTSTVITPAISNKRHGIQIVYQDASSLVSRVNTLEDNTLPKMQLARKILAPCGNILKQSFNTTTLPSNWTQAGGWEATSNGLSSPDVGGWGVYLTYRINWVMDEETMTTVVRVNDEESIFCVGKASSQQYGSCFEVDFVTRKLKIMSTFTGLGATPSTLLKQVDIPFFAIPGREYSVTIEKKSEIYSVQLTDNVTLESVSVFYDARTAAVNAGKMWNNPYIVFRQGSISILSVQWSSKLPRSPYMLIVGDSIVDADTIRNELGGGFAKRWAGLLSDYLAFNTAIIARGGETTTQLNEKLPIISSLFRNPRYLLYEAGINDTSFATWQTNMLAYKAMIESKGGEIILVTLFPRSGREAFCLQVTNYILSSGMRYVDFNRCFTTNGDRNNRDLTLLLADQLHPNVVGHQKAFNQILTDLADIL